jgi:hypothetical protein
MYIISHSIARVNGTSTTKDNIEHSFTLLIDKTINICSYMSVLNKVAILPNPSIGFLIADL